LGPIVVVEDEEDVLGVVCDAFESEGYNVLGFPSPTAVDGLSPSVDPELFLIDIMLPGMSGIDLAKQLRADRFAQTPMVAMSASSVMLRAASEALVFEDTLQKPFDLVQLLDVAERHVATTQSQDG
jgi:CheY-like chemotaxis protein